MSPVDPDEWQRALDADVARWKADRAAAAELEARQEAEAKPPRRRNGVSTVFTLRLGNDELELLQVRALQQGLPPSVLARNFIRIGLNDPGATSLSEAVTGVEEAVARLRRAAGYTARWY